MTNKNHKPTITEWVLVADRHQAKVYQVTEGAKPAWPCVAMLTHAESRLQPRELETDAPGRVILPGGARSAVEPHEDRVIVEAKKFARQVVDQLDHDRQAQKFHRLYIVAEPTFLGILRETLPNPLKVLVVHEQSCDLVELDDHELTKRLKSLLNLV